MAAKRVSRKRHIKKNIESGVVHAHSTLNNTVAMITDTHGNALAWSPAGSLGFKGSKRSTPFAVQMAAEVTTKMATEHGPETVDVIVRRPNSGCEAAIRSLQATGLEAIIVRDVTPVPRNGYRPPKHRRV